MELLLPAIVALTVALLIWGVITVMSDPATREKRRLSQRLSNETRNDPSDPVAKSIRRQLDVVGLPPAIAGHPLVQALNRRLIQAYPNASIVKFLLIAAGTGIVGCGIFLVVTGSMLMSLAGFALGAYVPFFVLNSKRAKRQRQMAEQLPEALDFLSRVLKAGHSFSTGLQMMADELPAPLSHEIRRCYDQHSLGQSLDDSLRDTSLRIDSTDFAFFVTALLIQRQTGGDLSEVLKNISGMIRSRGAPGAAGEGQDRRGALYRIYPGGLPGSHVRALLHPEPRLLPEAPSRHRPLFPGHGLRAANARAVHDQEDHDDQGVM
jgi:tight adherence protein B